MTKYAGVTFINLEDDGSLGDVEVFLSPEELADLLDADPDCGMAVSFYENIGRRMTGNEVIAFFKELEKSNVNGGFENEYKN